MSWVCRKCRFSRGDALCVQTKDTPTAILILRLGGLRRPQLVSPKENKGDESGDLSRSIPSHHRVAKTSGKLMGEEKRPVYACGCLEILGAYGRTFGACVLEGFDREGITEQAVEGPFSISFSTGSSLRSLRSK